MKVLWYLAVPLILVTAYSVGAWARNRNPTSLESGVESFRREMQALSPEAARDEQRRTERPPGSPPNRRAAPPGRR